MRGSAGPRNTQGRSRNSRQDSLGLGKAWPGAMTACAGLSSDFWLRLGRVTKAITSSDVLNSFCTQRERALDSDRWSLLNLAVLVLGSGRVQSACLCHGHAAAEAAEGNQGPALAAQTNLMWSRQALDFRCQLRWALTPTLAKEAEP